MPINIFVSFEFDRDNDLRNNFYRQAEEETEHRIRDCSLHESYPDEYWKNKARNAIRPCDVVVVLIGEDTHNAQGVMVETDMARSFGKPIIQVRPQGRPYQGLTRLGDPITWRWSRINAVLDEIASGSR
ncbi:MAG: TIR domain-containing protein [Chloroflexi bacterium]|nr:TIR domain-containing protein [Chloroflexota bacterium]